MNFERKEKYGFNDLVDIMKILRSPDGCPWDRVQTHESIRQDFIEETYEAIEAIDTADTELLREELGDVMLQVVFHSVMEEEKGSFDISDVCDEVCKKLIIRHPHVFSDTIADTPEEVLKNWDKIKMNTKSQKSQSEVLASVSKALPALMYSQKIQKKAAKVGFDFENTEDTLMKVEEELSELKTAIKNNDEENMSEELGDLLFSDKKARHRHVSFHMRDEKQIYFRLVMFHRPIIQHIAQFVKPFFVKNAHETSNIYNLFLFSPLLHGKTPKTRTNLTSIFTK